MDPFMKLIPVQHLEYLETVSTSSPIKINNDMTFIAQKIILPWFLF
ncbi:MAG: hypothetical protein ACI83B_002285 [Sediminicola sp.]|jgi:hypothetical protein